MPQVINTNIASMNAQRNLSNSQMTLQTALQRLSSGLRINSAKDDAAGLAISDRMTSQVRGLNQAVRNSNDGISMSQTAEGALGEIGNILQRVRELSIQASNATNSDSDRATLQAEVVQLKSELSRIANNTTFNGQRILDGSMQSASFQVGADAAQTIKMSINSASSQSLGVNMKATDNTRNGLTVATDNYRVDSGGGNATLMGKAIAATTVSSTSNAYSAQTLIIKDSIGNVLVGGSISLAAGEQVSEVASRLNAISGVRATGSTQFKLTSIQSGLSSDGVATFSVTLSSGTVTSTLNIAGVTTASSQSAIFAAIRDSINGDSDLANAGVVAGLNASGQLVVRNNTGADLGFTIDQSATSTVVFSIVGSDVASTALTISANGVAGEAGDAIRVGGQLSVYLADGYTIQSSKGAASSYFNASASAQVAASANGVGIDDVVTNTIPSNYVAANGALVSKAIAAFSAGVVASQTNAYSAQTLTIRDSTGAKLAGGDSIVIAAGASVDSVVTSLNNLAGVTASASATLQVYDYTIGGASVTGSLSFAIVSGSTSINLTLASVAATATDIDVFKAMRDAINADTTLAGAGVTASIDATGYLSIKNTDGKNLGLQLTGGNNLGSVSSFSFAARGTDAAATSITISSAATNGVIGATSATMIGGTLKISLADGYTVSSNATKASSYFDVNANAKATVVESGVNHGTRTAAQTLTIVGKSTGTVAIAKDDSADRIAQLVNGQTVATGVTATARTQAKLSNLSTAGTVSFTLYGDGGASAAISALVTGSGTTANLSALASAINVKSSTTGITAKLADNNASLILTNDSGANIEIMDFNHSAASAATASNITGTQASLMVTGLSDTLNALTGATSTATTTSVTLYKGGTTSLGADSTSVGGTVSFSAADSFTVSSNIGASSRIGGNSSLLATDASAISSSTLFNVATVDVSTVDGANQAIGAIDGALTQVNAVRSAMGALQNRFLSTISSLSAASENIASARSRIQDTDFAAETANLTRSQILQQAGVAMLAQANQLPQLVLSLLK
ncbi:MAG: flagellin [Sterolibacterium sp.]